ncbi:MAG: hypothetical protein LBG77_04930 [Dysgonamonadaceae bacterium]|jgi:hypothetical protein|nr:hypothetical protein [Dysgonamonadaceae bacterium]
MNRFLQINNTVYFWALCLLYAIFALLSKQFLFTDQLYYSSMGEQFTTEQIQRILAYQNAGWKQGIGYTIIPLIIIIRVLYTSFCLQIGNLVNETRWKYKSLYNLSLKADIAFCFSSIANFYYYAISGNYQTTDDLGVNCCSLLKIVGKESIPDWLIFAFNSINIFELFYVILLILFIKACFNLSFWKSTVFVLLTYFIGNYLYVVGLTFLYLNFS